ncbi:diguanylate cyclase [Neptuniibacter sp. 1_MG-2023]|uniref:diguanylate cyclase n=1 Tax=Neptuniibacter sp. 1_MG-2023 TaxID=3062662 RepID=UPI0026E30621|nr:diguanylate cyclase [Neptuniibacter sp. 1_MG-2023]MDO6592488.1 diguanylate cyclase [Neptuniibacter sp. 1_MG-2023]
MRLLFASVFFILLSGLASAKDTIDVRLLWKHQFQFAGYYMAIEKGFYAEENLNVRLKEYDFNLDLVDEVIQGESQFGIARTSLLIDKNAGADVVALFAAYQQSPLMLLTRKDSNILLSSDLKNKNVMITNDAKKVGEIIAMLLQAGITVSDFNQQEHSYNPEDLINGKTDAMASYISNEPFHLEKQGVEYNTIHPKDYGFDMYSDILFTSREFVEKNPEITDRFYRASIRGWLYAFEHIEETAEVIFKYYNSQDKSLSALIYEGEELRKLAFDHNGNFGTLSINKFNEMAQVYLITGSIFLGYDFSDFIYRPLSNMYRLSQAEQSYLDENPKVKVCVHPDWYPFESYWQGKYQGILADYLQLIMGNVGLEYEIVPSITWKQSLKSIRTGGCDLLAGAMQTVERSQYLDFTRPYLSVPAVIAVKTDENKKYLPEMTLGVIDKSAFQEILSIRYPNLKILSVDHVVEGLRLLQAGTVDGFVGADANIAHIAKEFQIADIAISDELRDSWDFSIAIRNDMPYLQSILNKSIAKITPEERDAIINRWLVVEYKHTVDYTIIWIVIGVSVVLALLGLYRYIQVISYNKMLKTIAEKDALTGIFSRHKLRSELESFTELAKRHNWSLSVIFFDIDNFKQINDSLGHDVGDKVLLALSKLISKMTRKTDRFGRWGGEEFLFLMLETDLDKAHKIAEKFRLEICQHQFGLPMPVTCSFGVAQYKHNESIEHWVSRADKAMYQAKHEGKNCVRVS